VNRQVDLGTQLVALTSEVEALLEQVPRLIGLAPESSCSMASSRRSIDSAVRLRPRLGRWFSSASRYGASFRLCDRPSAIAALCVSVTTRFFPVAIDQCASTLLSFVPLLQMCVDRAANDQNTDMNTRAGGPTWKQSCTGL
jgi:hypothetical protein